LAIDLVPLISIVTVNRNDADGLRRTLYSVMGQTFRDFEHIVIDGASSDSSVEVLAEYDSQLSYWVSEPDGGIYNAMNKGIANSRGRYLLFLNSGDHLAETTSLESAARHLADVQIVYFDLEIRGPDSEERRIFSAPPVLSLGFFLESTLPHPSTFIASNLFAAFGPYDESMRIAADWKAFLLFVCKHECEYRHVPELLSIFYADGISSQQHSLSVIRAEREKVLRSDFRSIVADIETGLKAKKELERLRRHIAIRILRRLGIIESF